MPPDGSTVPAFDLARRVLDGGDIGRAITRIAHEIVERNHGSADLILLGIHTRGVPLADRLAAEIEEIEGKGIPTGRIDIGLYRDDLDTRPKTRIGKTEVPEELDGSTVVLVDDVLFTGRTIRAALDAITDLGRPSRIQLAGLVDRGHRELPIRPDYVGKNLPTSLDERVKARFAETDDGEEGVWIERGGDG
jgi:pyrimidine operon attenuation protein/uracil phosphoribosyltransferase